MSLKSRLKSGIHNQDEKGRITDAAQHAEPMRGAEAVREGIMPRHERTEGEGDTHDIGGDEHHVVPLATYLKIFGALMVLLVLTLLAYQVDFAVLLGPRWAPLNIIIAMAIATAKALLVVLYFMHVKFSSKLTWVFSSASFVFVFIMFLLTMSDYFTRGFLDTAGR